jgi:hypothetical protein
MVVQASHAPVAESSPGKVSLLGAVKHGYSITQCRVTNKKIDILGLADFEPPTEVSVYRASFRKPGGATGTHTQWARLPRSLLCKFAG